ncbi:MAG: multiheme c-type cytochrome [Enhygromyxa sp.]
MGNSSPVEQGGTGETGAAEESLDPLSMPSEPTLSSSSFHSSQVCAGCHPNHVAEWQLSRHARSMRDPVFRALVALRRDHLQGTAEQFCTQCHSTICTRSGECESGFSFEELPPIALEGVTCESCHKISAIVRPYNAGHELDPTGPLRGPIPDPIDNGFHASEHAGYFDESPLCGSCHDVIAMSGLVLEQPYAEWLGSPANPEQPCQGCHMPTYSGKAAIMGPERDELHRHRFVGVDLPLEGDVDEATLAELDAEIDALLTDAASVELELPDAIAAGQQLELRLTIENRIAGHAFPTGSTFIRQAWLELRVVDADAKLLYASGELDSEGDLRDRWSTLAPSSDPDLIVLGSGFTDAHGEPELFSWRATEHRSNALAPRERRSYARSLVVPDEAVGPLRVEATLHFRSHPPFLLRMLGLGELVELAVVRDVASASGSVELRR